MCIFCTGCNSFEIFVTGFWHFDCTKFIQAATNVTTKMLQIQKMAKKKRSKINVVTKVQQK